MNKVHARLNKELRLIAPMKYLFPGLCSTVYTDDAPATRRTAVGTTCRRFTEPPSTARFKWFFPAPM